MILKLNATALLLVAICHTSSAWMMIQTSKVIPGVALSSMQSYRLPTDSLSVAKTSLTALFGTSSDDNAPKRKRKRKKKVQVVDVEDITTVSMDEKEPEPTESKKTSTVLDVKEPESTELESMSTALDLKPREDAPIQLEVKNILFSSTEPEPSALASVSSFLSSIIGSKDTSTSTTNASPTTNNKPSDIGSFGGRPLDDSLDQLLEDARLMKEEEKDGGVLSDEEGTGIKEMIGNALSTIVTADFFVVLGFLAWFLLGIFCSYILKDDTVQIAFNNNFERLVQPALGVLAIAAIGGGFFQEEEQEYDL